MEKTMDLTRQFPTLDVISAMTGVLLVEDYKKMLAVLEWMAGEEVYTHQIPRLVDEARTVLLDHHPNLSPAVTESVLVNEDNWEYWARHWIAAFGPTISVPVMSANEHRNVDPQLELAEMVAPERIVTVKDFDMDFRRRCSENLT